MKSLPLAVIAACGVCSIAFAADESFYEEAARGGMAEVALGRLASAKGSNERVKGFGRQMVTDHGAAGAKLEAAAGRSKVMLPTGVAPDAQATQKRLETLSGPEFDKAYIDSQVRDHAKTIALLEKEISSGTDANAKAWATETLPTVKQHAMMIHNLNRMPADHGEHPAGSDQPAGAPGAPRTPR